MSDLTSSDTATSEGATGQERVTLDEAWAEAEAALPKAKRGATWKLRLVWHPLADDPAVSYEARYDRSDYEWTSQPTAYVGRGSAPVAALRALAAALRESLR